MNIQTLDRWHKTKIGFVVFALVELALAYLFASLAINSGSIWQWLLTLVLLLGTGQNIVRLLGTFFHGNTH